MEQILKSDIIDYINNIDIAYNEVVSNASINRNLEKLLENDKMLLQKADETFKSLDFVSEYVPGYSYNRGDAVFYIQHRYDERKNTDGVVISRVHTIENIFLLKSLVDNNTNEPSYVEANGLYYFDESGWKNQNNFGSIFFTLSADEKLKRNEDFITYKSKYLPNAVKTELYSQHESSKNYHKFGTLSGPDELSSKVLYRDFSNVSAGRKQYFWPDGITRFDTVASMSDFSGAVHGESTIEKWNNGILQYNIVFSFVNSNVSIPVFDENGNRVASTTQLYPNNVEIMYPVDDEESETYNENGKYFNDIEDYNIFKQKGTSDYSSYSSLKQANVLPYQNVYSCTLEFPVPFKDLNYMIFNSMVMKKNGTAQSVNTMTYVNKTRNSISPIYVVYNPDSNELDKAVLQNNTFYCQIVGRWK